MKHKSIDSSSSRIGPLAGILSFLIFSLVGFGSVLQGAALTFGPVQAAQDPTEELERLRSRRMSTRPSKTIFSPLDLPAPNRMRTATGRPGEDYWQQQADYKIDVKLDAEKESVAGIAHVTYTNNSPEALDYIWISLEQNLFRKDSHGSKFTPPRSRYNNRTGFEGGLEIEYVRHGDKDLQLQVYDTLGRIDLPQAIPAKGGKLEFDIAWNFNIPDYGVDRMGIRRVKAGKIFQLAQWFPNICKFDDVHGWNTLPYLGQGEFYTEFGNYEVKITAPRGHVVCATGELVNAKDVLTEKQFTQLQFAKSSKQTIKIRTDAEIGKEVAYPAGEGPMTWHFKADKVRTFAWTSSDATVWDAASITWDDGTITLVQSVYPREARVAWSESTQMLRQSILHYSEKWCRYPYPTAVNVNGDVGGMEYPMILFCGGDTDKADLHSVTSHEIGHNWFPMMVNTDERRHAWMDEGFNTFMNTYDRYEDYEAIVNGAEDPGKLRRASLSAFGRSLSDPEMQPIALPADQIRPELLGQLAYFKPGEGMRFLREVILGPERFDAAFKQYIKDWSFKSPQPADFFRCMENGAGMDLAWFWRGWFLENLPLDQAVVSVRENTRRGTASILIANREEMVMPVFLTVDFTEGDSKEIELPVEVWSYSNLWTTTIELEGRTIQAVAIDRRRTLPDANRSNNSWRPKPKEQKSESGAEPAEEKPDDSSNEDDDQ